MKTLGEINLLKNEREAIEKAVVATKAKFPVVKVILFGSKARGDDDVHSDIDLAIITSRQTPRNANIR
jgi:predicted nucleotidyltransferase